MFYGHGRVLLYFQVKVKFVNQPKIVKEREFKYLKNVGIWIFGYAYRRFLGSLAILVSVMNLTRIFL